MRAPRPSPDWPHRGEAGYALLSVCLMLLILLTLGAASTVYTTLDLRSTAHYDTGNGAFAAAEAGVLHAVSTMNEMGVLHFERDVVERWSTLYGTATKTVPSLPALRYQVTVASDPAAPALAGTITATGLASLGARRAIRVTVRRGLFTGSPGAIYLAADGVTSQFTGNAFEINGNDHDVFGDPVPSGPIKPGIATRNDGVNQTVSNSLNNTQKDNVKGQGFSWSPLTPSVLPTGGPSVSDLDQIVSHLLSLPGTVTTAQKNFTGNSTFGTIAQPRVTHMTNTDVTLAGNASGAGVLITDGSITISGSLDFVGWIIVRGATVINASGSTDDSTFVLGNATILGSLWTGHLDIKVGGSAIVDYCDACLRLVDALDAANGATPRPMQVVAWQEIL